MQPVKTSAVTRFFHTLVAAYMHPQRMFVSRLFLALTVNCMGNSKEAHIYL